MEDVIAPISKELLKAELTEEKRLRMTNRSHNQIYIITAQDSPNTMKEIGRLHSVLREEERASLWILMNMTSWTTRTSS
jgi:hypothetical protein